MTEPPIDLAAHRRRRAQRQRDRALGAAAPTVVDTKKRTTSLAQFFSRPDKVDIQLGPGEVPCPRCRAPIPGNARRCSSCGVHFNGRAENFAPKTRYPLWVRLVIVAIILSFVAAALWYDWLYS
jgi:hypothetical protein